MLRLLLFVALLAGGSRAWTQTLAFDEPGFPVVGIDGPIVSIDRIGGTVCEDGTTLAAKLPVARLLVWRHGSGFPSEAWPAFVRFLERGGSIVHLGGEPFTRPVTGKPGERVVQPRTLALLKQIGINQCRSLDVGGRASVAILEPRLTDARDYADEDGSAGPRDAVVHALIPILTDPDRPDAHAIVVIARVRGRFAGGKWSFFLLSRPPSDSQIRTLVESAGFSRLAGVRFDPTFACFRAGEKPSILVRRTQAFAAASDLSLQIRAGKTMKKIVLRSRFAQQRVELDGPFEPGFHPVFVDLDKHPGVIPVTGFWVYDDKLFRSGEWITVDDYTMRRGKTPEPMIGTTIMSKSVHRKFLFEPNPAEWDRTFAELKEIGVNVVRTGIWTGYRKISLDAGHVDESFLRALEAFYLTARRHEIAVIFTFFAFVPPAFGGESPYFDPRSLEGQSAFAAAIAGRFRGARQMLWDLINEPSFANPKKLWLCRPVGDPFETAAFRGWLKERYGDEWQARVRARWRLAPGEPIGVPAEADFAEPHLFGSAKPYRARDWLLFAQDAFADWAKRLRLILQQHGAPVPITVGQDEGGLIQRPHPQLHADYVDYTSIHSWWLNDNLLWDTVMAKVRGKPLLVSETGIMGREKLDGEALRDPGASAALLSRKIGYAFAGGAFGVIQWCYDVNPYMLLDNEVAIGIRRVDGSYKPEHAELKAFASFFQRNRTLFEGHVVPDVVVLIPHTDGFPPRGLAIQGSQRIVEILGRQLAVPIRAVSVYRTKTDLGKPRVIVLPACRGLPQSAVDDIEATVRNGATLVCGGWFEADDAGLPAHRLGNAKDSIRPRLLAREERTARGVLRFPIDVFQSLRAADIPAPTATALGRGKILHHPTPIDLAEPCTTQRDWFAAAVGVEPTPGFRPFAVKFRDATLVIGVNEASTPQTFQYRAHDLTVPAGHARMFFFDNSGKLLDRSHPE